MGVDDIGFLLDTAPRRVYHHPADGRVKVSEGLQDFKNDRGGIRLLRILPCWIASGLFFLYLQILMV